LDFPLEIRERLLLALLSTPPVEALTVIYSQSWVLDDGLCMVFEDKAYPLWATYARPPPALEATKFTNLRKLTLRPDGVRLSWLSEALRLPRRLEILILQFSLLRALPYRYPVADTALDSMLEPVAHSLRTLIIEPHDSHEIANSRDALDMGDVGFRWTPRGLREFQHLETLGIPGSVFGDQWRPRENGVDAHPLTVPASIEEINLLDAMIVPLKPGMLGLENLTLR
jgi:hypothetical protein